MKITRYIGILLLVVLLYSMLSVGQISVNAVEINSTDNLLFGDLDGDGKLSSDDIQLYSNFITGIETESDEQLIIGDVNNNGALDITDQTIVIQVINGTNSYETIPALSYYIAYGCCGSSVKYVLNKSGDLIIFGNGSMGYYSYSYKAPWYSYRESIKTVKINSGVTSIGDFAFFNCESLTSITIPDSVTSIGGWAFYSCISLKNISVDSNNKNYSSLDGNLYNKNKTKLIQYVIGKTDKSFFVPNSVISISDSAFSSCTSLTSITIPNSVISIGYEAFEYCTSLTSITIPNSVTSIGNYAFFYCTSLTSINVDSDNKYFSSLNGNLYDKNNTKLIQYAIGKTTTSFSIPNSVTSIGRDAFSGCTSLTSVTISNSVTSIGDSAFSNCRRLTSVTIPDGVTSIGNYTFLGCASMTDVYYTGSSSQWNNISIGTSNEELKNATIHYNYGKYTYTINFYGNGGSGVPSSISKTGTGTSVVMGDISKVIPTREGYTFYGWSANSSWNLKRIAYSSTTGGETASDNTKAVSTSSSWTYQDYCNYTGGSSSSTTLNLYAMWNDETKPSASISSVTNNVATSQTVTLTMSDTAGIAGYYWGTSSNYSSNTYTSTSSTSITKTVSSAGTYYFTAKDVNGNVSSTQSVTFYNTTLNANGGSVSPSYVITKSGNTFTLPTPTRTGYTFLGWSTSSSATSATYFSGGNFTTNSNTTLYAVWNKVPIQNTTTKATTTSTTITKSSTTQAKEEYLVSTMLQNVVSNNSINKVSKGSSYQVILNPQSGYRILSVEVKMNNATLYPTVTDNSCIINISSVTGNVSIIAVAEKINVTTIGFEKNSVTMYAGDYITVKPTITNKEGNTTYKSSNTGVAKVDNTGKITAIKAGSAKITVTNNGVSASMTVTVKTFALKKTTVTLNKGKIYKVGVKDKVGTLKYTTSNKKVATVTLGGVIKATGKGTAIITVTSVGQSKNQKNTLKVTVKQPVTKIEIYYKNKKVTGLTGTMNKGKTGEFKAVCTPSNANNKAVTWKTSNSKIATITQSGKMKAKAVGKVVITVTAKDGSGKTAKFIIKIK